jgi:ABC-type antimicrobial peptide transport system permease subunit
MAHMVRFRGDPAAIIPEVRKAVHAHNPRLRPRIATADHLFDTALARERFLAGVAWALSAVALVLAGAGLYAAVAYAVSQRSGEIAVRIALGASARSVGLLVVRDPLRTTVAGILAGVPGTWLLMRWASALLFDVSPFDAVTVTACAGALVAFALAAAARPALRATGIDPIAALRST